PLDLPLIHAEHLNESLNQKWQNKSSVAHRSTSYLISTSYRTIEECYQKPRAWNRMST
ncbi:hypothetical protein MKW98_002213, partial [Papaver atlanticum]